MPEGDVLRRTARRLDQALAGQVLVRAELRWPDAATVDLVGRTVLGTFPYGKHLLTRLDDGRTLHTHLRMDGSWTIARTGSPQASGSGSWVRAVLSTTAWTAIGTRLGMLDVVATKDESLLIGHLGPDVLADDFPQSGLTTALSSLSRLPGVDICEALLDQRVVAGIGTIFTAESLHTCRVWPWTAVADVRDLEGLLLTARRLMGAAVLHPWHGPPSGADRRPAVHGRLHQQCRRCGTPIAVGNARRPPFERPIFYCPTCQRAT